MPKLSVTSGRKFRRITFTQGRTVREILDRTDLRVRSSCGGTGTCGLCSILVMNNELNEFTTAELNKLTPGDRAKGIRLACQLRPRADTRITINRPAPESNWKSLPTHSITPAFDRIQSLLGSSPVHQGYGVAIDVGTTQIRVSLWDMKTGRRVTGRSGLNPQAVYGADVITRMVKAAQSPEHAQEISGLIKNAIAEAMQDILFREAIAVRDIVRFMVVGNTQMLSFLTGKNHDLLIRPKYWTKEVECIPKDLTPFALLWGGTKKTQIEIAKPMAGFVGSDLLAGIISTQLLEGPAGSLLMDFGTNSEIALWDGKKVWITSAAGGPAFEGCGISYGLPAEPGAVYTVTPGEAGTLMLKVIDGAEPKGICGSGLVDTVAYLINSGQLKKNGRFVRKIHEMGYPILPGEEGIFLKTDDVDMFQRAKAGIAAGVKCLIKRSGIHLGNLQRVCVCGAFGTYLSIKNGQAVGLLPAIPVSQVELCGNTALTGCELLLFSPTLNELQLIKEKSKLINMSADKDFEQQFIQNLFLQPMQEG